MGALFGVATALVVVFGLLGVTLAALRRYTQGGRGARGHLPLEVVQRLSLGPKQGIALVRMGERVVAVSMGEGGVHTLLELDGAERDALLAPPPPVVALPAPVFQRDFRALLKAAMRSAALLLVLGGAVATVDVLPASAQVAPSVTRPEVRPPAVEEPVGATVARADTMMTRLAPTVDLKVGDPGEGGLRLSGTVGVVVLMGLLTLLPTLLLMMTSFTRILIVLHFLKQAFGAQAAPPAHLIAGLALLLTGFVMAPTFSELNRTALQPWMEGRMEQGEMIATGVKPFRAFMLDQTRDRDIETFLEMSETGPVASVDEVPLVVLTSAFVISELRTAFQMGFALFLPFIVIDIVVASVLMSMGMFMLPPAMISLPFKLLLFVLVDGWSLVVQSLVASFR